MNNFICKHCNFSLTIQKGGKIQIIKLNTPIEFVNAMKSEENNEYEIAFEKTELDTYLNKKSIKPDYKKQLLEKYIKLASKEKTVLNYILKCSTCGSEYPLNPETTIYSLNFKFKNTSFNDNYLDLKLYDPTLPRTKDYICPNDNCETNKKNYDTSNKEAVFYRSSNSYHIKYACLNCKTSWNI